MSWIRRFLGIYDKEQKARTEAVNNYVQEQKEQFNKQMADIHKEARQVHRESNKTAKESVKISRVVNDVTARIAIATGGVI